MTAEACAPDCAYCAATACRTCEESQSPLKGPCFKHKAPARHHSEVPPAPPGPAPRCPGCGVSLEWSPWQQAFACESGKHPGEGVGVRLYCKAEGGRLRPASSKADPSSTERVGMAEVLEALA